MHRVSHGRKNSRIEHLASLGWMLQNDNNPNSPIEKSLPYSIATHKKSPTSPASDKDQLRGRALSVSDVNGANSVESK